MRIFPNGEQGKPAVTHYKVLERFGYVTLVQCRLETTYPPNSGTYEAYRPYPFNDERYGGNDVLRGTRYANYKQFVNNCFALCPRQCLHACLLGFTHPETKETLLFKSDMPADMQAVIDKWRVYRRSQE